MYDMVNIFEVFLPQLLRYPNPTDPLNGEAAALMMREEKSYNARVKGRSPTLASSSFGHTPCRYTDCHAEYVSKYASKEAVDDAGEESEEDDEMSSVGSVESGDEDEPAGTMDEV